MHAARADDAQTPLGTVPERRQSKANLDGFCSNPVCVTVKG
ncbi:hypothetical protein [Burkholderia alba]|nr:hypothetical protein [Burkholderia alba]